MASGCQKYGVCQVSCGSLHLTWQLWSLLVKTVRSLCVVSGLKWTHWQQRLALPRWAWPLTGSTWLWCIMDPHWVPQCFWMANWPHLIWLDLQEVMLKPKDMCSLGESTHTSPMHIHLKSLWMKCIFGKSLSNQLWLRNCTIHTEESELMYWIIKCYCLCSAWCQFQCVQVEIDNIDRDQPGVWAKTTRFVVWWWKMWNHACKLTPMIMNWYETSSERYQSDMSHVGHHS